MITQLEFKLFCLELKQFVTPKTHRIQMNLIESKDVTTFQFEVACRKLPTLDDIKDDLSAAASGPDRWKPLLQVMPVPWTGHFDITGAPVFHGDVLRRAVDPDARLFDKIIAVVLDDGTSFYSAATGQHLNVSKNQVTNLFVVVNSALIHPEIVSHPQIRRMFEFPNHTGRTYTIEELAQAPDSVILAEAKKLENPSHSFTEGDGVPPKPMDAGFAAKLERMVVMVDGDIEKFKCATCQKEWAKNGVWWVIHDPDYGHYDFCSEDCGKNGLHYMFLHYEIKRLSNVRPYIFPGHLIQMDPPIYKQNVFNPELLKKRLDELRKQGMVVGQTFQEYEAQRKTEITSSELQDEAVITKGAVRPGETVEITLAPADGPLPDPYEAAYFRQHPECATLEHQIDYVDTLIRTTHIEDSRMTLRKIKESLIKLLVQSTPSKKVHREQLCKQCGGPIVEARYTLPGVLHKFCSTECTVKYHQTTRTSQEGPGGAGEAQAAPSREPFQGRMSDCQEKPELPCLYPKCDCPVTRIHSGGLPPNSRVSCQKKESCIYPHCMCDFIPKPRKP